MTNARDDSERPGREGAWVLHMRWHDVLFAHWPFPPEVVQAVLPPPLRVETWEGQAWLGIVPFRMTDVRPRYLPAVPYLSDFPELNVRTYVSVGGVHGVHFFSLDAANAIAVMAARRLHLNYLDAEMSCERAGDELRYRSRRTHPGAPPAELVGNYLPVGAPFSAKRGTLDDWLTSRHALLTCHDGSVARMKVDHEPWTLQAARAHFDVNTMAQAAGLGLPAIDPVLHFSREIDVVAYRPEPIVESTRVG